MGRGFFIGGFNVDMKRKSLDLREPEVRATIAAIRAMGLDAT
jgi:hypothetical protein